MSTATEVIPRGAANGAPSTEVVHVPRGGEVTKADFTPIFSVEDAIARKQQIGKIIAGVLEEGKDRDYGKLPGGTDKKILFKPGAEKLASMFGLTPRYIAERETEDWTGKDHGEPFFYFRYRCQLFRGELLLGEAIGSCNSWETKYRYRWITAEDCAARGLNPAGLPNRGGVQTLTEPDFAIAKGETGGKYGKPAEHWEAFRQAIQAGTAIKGEKEKKDGGVMPTWSIRRDTTLYRIPNPDIADVVNTVQKMAQKRAFVAVVLVATNASDSFTQDLEDFVEHPDIDTGGHAVGTQAAADHVRDTKLSAPQATPQAPAATVLAAGRGTAASVPPSAAAPPAERLFVPEELTIVFANLAKPNGPREALAMLKRELLEALPNSGAIEYQRLVQKYGIHKNGWLSEQLKKCLIEMWGLAQWARKQTAVASEVMPPEPPDGLFGDQRREAPYAD